MGIIYSKCYNGVIMVPVFADDSVKSTYRTRLGHWRVFPRRYLSLTSISKRINFNIDVHRLRYREIFEKWLRYRNLEFSKRSIQCYIGCQCDHPSIGCDYPFWSLISNEHASGFLNSIVFANEDSFAQSICKKDLASRRQSMMALGKTIRKSHFRRSSMHHDRGL